MGEVDLGRVRFMLPLRPHQPSNLFLGPVHIGAAGCLADNVGLFAGSGVAVE